MAYIICEPCIGTKDSACVDVCPVDCIHPRKDEPEFETAEMLYIHPDECIDCGACVPACPVEAIFALDETPEKWKNYIPVNAAVLSEIRQPSVGSRQSRVGSRSRGRQPKSSITRRRGRLARSIPTPAAARRAEHFKEPGEG